MKKPVLTIMLIATAFAISAQPGNGASVGCYIVIMTKNNQSPELTNL